MSVATAPRSLAEIENRYCGSVFPGKHVFAGCDTALCLFSAEWYGMQDAYWIAKHGMRGACIDLNGEKLSEMAAVYPAGWEFRQADAFEFAADAVADGRQWDVLTLDPYSGLFERCAGAIGTWTSLARRVVVLGHGNYRLDEPAAPDGWQLHARLKRSTFKGGVYWLVFTRA